MSRGATATQQSIHPRFYYWRRQVSAFRSSNFNSEARQRLVFVEAGYRLSSAPAGPTLTLYRFNPRPICGLGGPFDEHAWSMGYAVLVRCRRAHRHGHRVYYRAVVPVAEPRLIAKPLKFTLDIR